MTCYASGRRPRRRRLSVDFLAGPFMTKDGVPVVPGPVFVDPNRNRIPAKNGGCLLSVVGLAAGAWVVVGSAGYLGYHVIRCML